MDIAFCTHVSEDWYIPVGCQKLERSAKHFHPDIPFFTFKDDVIKAEFDKDSHTHWLNIHPIIASKLTEMYDLIVHFDADSVIVGSLDEILVGDYEVAGVRNNNDLGKAGADPPITLGDIGVGDVGVFRYINAGLVAATNKQFWLDWSDLTRAQSFPYGEQGALNVLFYSGKYKTKLLDPLESNVHYGTSNCDGNRPACHYDSWKEIRVLDNELYLKHKKVKVLHQAGAGLPRFTPDLFNHETLVYLEQITKTKF
jgi:hypothetical protein